VYDSTIASCIPENTQGGLTAGALQAPDRGSIPQIAQAIPAPDENFNLDDIVIGDGSLGSICSEDGDCETENCYYGMMEGPGGMCACNPDTHAGCTGDFECFPDLEEARGIADMGPTCFLPFNASCVPGEYKCVTGNCDKATERCGCGSEVHYPCDREKGEQCIFTEKEGHICQVLEEVSIPVPENSKVGITAGAQQAPDELMIPEIGMAIRAPDESFYLDDVVIGDGSIGSICLDNSDCKSDNCNYGFRYGAAGLCACNPSTNVGCTDGFNCLANVEETQGIADLGPGCYLPYNATCSPGDYCETGQCDKISGRCPCNTFTGYPCDAYMEEICAWDPVEGHICKVPAIQAPVISIEGEGDSRIPVAGGMVAPDELIMIPEIGQAIPLPPLDEQVEVGDGSLQSICYENTDCDSELCNYGMWYGGYGLCTCNPKTNAGCEGGYVCSDNLIEAQRLADAPPACYLPFDSTCDPEKWDCLTGNCDKQTKRCACNTFSQYPCDQENEICVYDEKEGYICEVMERSLGSDCLSDKHCDSGSCYRDPNIPWDFPGFCVCTEKSGCEDGFICASGADQFGAQLLMDAPPRCLIDFGEPCNPQESTCLTGVCDKQTKLCACNLNTNYGCDRKEGEKCGVDENNLYVCKVVGTETGTSGSGIGISGIESDSAVLLGPPVPVDCPVSDGSTMCTMEYNPVDCSGCIYSNQCAASAASKEFTKDTCKPSIPEALQLPVMIDEDGP